MRGYFIASHTPHGRSNVRIKLRTACKKQAQDRDYNEDMVVSGGGGVIYMAPPTRDAEPALNIKTNTQKGISIWIYSLISTLVSVTFAQALAFGCTAGCELANAASSSNRSHFPF